jgi:hypothetical protein
LKDGKLNLNAMSGAARHDLRKMGIAVGMTDDGELELLERLSWFVLWAGRYPVPNTPEQMSPKRLAKSGPVIPVVIRPSDVKEAGQLAARLLEDSTPWK